MMIMFHPRRVVDHLQSQGELSILLSKVRKKQKLWFIYFVTKNTHKKREFKCTVLSWEDHYLVEKKNLCEGMQKVL